MTCIRLHAAQLQFARLGESALLLQFREIAGEQIAAVVRSAAAAIQANYVRHPFELVPGLESLAIHYPPQTLDSDLESERLRELLQAFPVVGSDSSRLVEIPVCYEQRCGADLAEVAQACGLAPEQVIHLQASAEYTVRLLGFTPGFPYLGGLPAQLALPRRATPRTVVPAGSLAIAAGLAGIYPQASPGGWHLLGRTPLRLFDPTRAPPTLLVWGDRVRFRPISWSEYLGLGGTP